jgi:flagellar protein FlgJ
VIGPVSPLAPRSASLPADRAALREAAEGFEAIMLRQLLASARASSFVEETPLTGGGMEQWRTMRDEHFADIAAKSGAFGFARSIEASLAQHLPAKGDS